VNDEFGFVRLRDCLGDLFGVFPRGVMAELVPDVAAHHPIVETVVRNNVNSGCHRLNSTPGDDCPMIRGEGAVTAINFVTTEKIGRI
jgi:hypothetical protein